MLIDVTQVSESSLDSSLTCEKISKDSRDPEKWELLLRSWEIQRTSESCAMKLTQQRRWQREPWVLRLAEPWVLMDFRADLLSEWCEMFHWCYLFMAEMLSYFSATVMDTKSNSDLFKSTNSQLLATLNYVTFLLDSFSGPSGTVGAPWSASRLFLFCLTFFHALSYAACHPLIYNTQVFFTVSHAFSHKPIPLACWLSLSPFSDKISHVLCASSSKAPSSDTFLRGTSFLSLLSLHNTYYSKIEFT